ncbi:hypothetical protein TAMA11512_03210 [Selenomonas sp. TAMA-11512]|nr:hypothetical protein TAMA11512_03210 [Selenomonas sp. TAMA-11512]
MKCAICQADMKDFERGSILKKYDVQYYRYPSCGFVCTEKSYWLEKRIQMRSAMRISG